MKSIPVLSLAAAVSVCLLALTVGAAEGPTRTVDQALQGRIVSLEKDVVEIVYDFKDPVQKRDWIGFKPFRVLGELTVTVEGDALHLKGTGALRHRATFLDTVSMEFDLTPRSDRDMGVVVAEDAESEQYVLYCVNDLYFQKWDGGKVPGHMICRFGVKDAGDKDGWKAFRYIARGTKPEIRPHQKIHVVASKDKKEDTFFLGDRKMSGKEMGRKISELHIGPYLVKSSCIVENVTIRGRLSPRWLQRENVKLTLSVPIPEDEGPALHDIEARSTVERFLRGTALPDEIFGVIENIEVSEDIREEAAQALIDTDKKSFVPRIMPLLYSEELSTRKLAGMIVKGLTGKSFGYDAKAEEATRSRAIQKLIKHMQKRPDEFRSSR